MYEIHSKFFFYVKYQNLNLKKNRQFTKYIKMKLAHVTVMGWVSQRAQ